VRYHGPAELLESFFRRRDSFLNLQCRCGSANNVLAERRKLSSPNSVRVWTLNSQTTASVGRLRNDDSQIVVDDDLFAFAAFQNEHDNLHFV
jgi:hypothetical protein